MKSKSYLRGYYQGYVTKEANDGVVEASRKADKASQYNNQGTAAMLNRMEAKPWLATGEKQSGAITPEPKIDQAQARKDIESAKTKSMTMREQREKAKKELSDLAIKRAQNTGKPNTWLPKRLAAGL
jgi:hypothetical protein